MNAEPTREEKAQLIIDKGAETHLQLTRQLESLKDSSPKPEPKPDGTPPKPFVDNSKQRDAIQQQIADNKQKTNDQLRELYPNRSKDEISGVVNRNFDGRVLDAKNQDQMSPSQDRILNQMDLNKDSDVGKQAEQTQEKPLNTEEKTADNQGGNDDVTQNSKEDMPDTKQNVSSDIKKSDFQLNKEDIEGKDEKEEKDEEKEENKEDSANDPKKEQEENRDAISQPTGGAGGSADSKSPPAKESNEPDRD